MDPPDSLIQLDAPIAQQLSARTKRTMEISMNLKQRHILDICEENGMECMLTPEQVCRILNIGETTLRRLRDENSK